MSEVARGGRGDATGRLLVLALGLLLVGGILGWWVQTGGGAIRVVEVRIPGPGGLFQYGRLFIPPGAGAEGPVPGIVAVHGYINSNETQSGFAIEFARRGWVVLAVDQPGHGYSDPPSGANQYGGPQALAFLRSLDFVDGDRIGLEGHSMGGWASLAAASAFPEGYRAIVLQGSGPIGAAQGAGARNVAVVFPRFDEFASLMWGTARAADAGAGERMRRYFDTGEEPVEPGRLYGSIEAGTARILHQPPVTHPGAHHSRAAIGHAVEWFDRTLGAPVPIPADRQVWYWKELGTLLALLGFLLLPLPVGALLLRTTWFAELNGRPDPPSGVRGRVWWWAAAIFLALPPLTLFPFKDLPGRWGISASSLLPQNLTTQVATWALLVSAISSVLFLVWRWRVRRVGSERGGSELRRFGWGRAGRVDPAAVGKSFLLAILVVWIAWGAVALLGQVFGVDPRFWVFAVKPPAMIHLRIALSYLVPFTLFVIVTATVLHGQLRGEDAGEGREILRNVCLLTGGFAALLAWQYGALFLSGALAIPGEPLWTIVAFQFLPILSLVGLVSTWFHRRTGEIWVGSFIGGMLVTWIVVASQATHVAF